MDERIRQNSLQVLESVLHAIRRGDIKSLKELSNMTIHTASVMQDQISISLAVIIYSLAKVFERTRYSQYKGWSSFCNDCVKDLERAYEELEHGEDAAFEESLKKYIGLISELDFKLKEYIHDVLLKAKITKGSRLYEHGISLERTAFLLGITQYELMDYIGKTHIADVRMKVLIHPKERMKIARGLFK